MYLTISTITATPSDAYEGVSQPIEPHLIHFAGIVTSANGYELDRLVTLVRPIGYPPLKEEEPFFGAITFVAAAKRGLSPGEVLEWFETRSLQVAMVIGHDIHRDLQNLAATADLLERPWRAPRYIFSTMYGSIATGVMPPSSLPRSKNKSDLSEPTLAECFEQAMGEPLEGALAIRTNADAANKLFRHIRWLISREEP